MKNQHKNIIWGTGIGLIILVGLIIIAKPSSSTNSGNLAEISKNQVSVQGALSAEEESFDFGSISMAAGKVSHAFKIKNSTDKPVTISKFYTSCMCTTALLAIGGRQVGPYGMPGHGFIPKVNERLNPGEEATFQVTFDPQAHGPAGVGAISRVVTIENERAPALQFRISATVTP